MNKPGTAATIARRMAEEGSRWNRSSSGVRFRTQGSAANAGPDNVAVILITYATTEDAVRR